jgi:hypothetical protein
VRARPQVINMLSVFFACGKDDPRFERHKARIDDYLWVAEVSESAAGVSLVPPRVPTRVGTRHAQGGRSMPYPTSAAH